MAGVVAFPEYAPDLTDIYTGVSSIISGVVPRADGYGPYKQFQAFTKALPGQCRGLFFARRTDDSIAVFAGTATRLYLLNNSDFSWTDVSKGGVAYSALVNTDNWGFVQFEDTVVAAQVNTPPQAFALAPDAAFSDLAGTPPQASHVAVIGGFLVLSGLQSAPKRVQWSDLFGITTWTAGVGLSDFQDLPDGGSVRGVAGTDYYGVVFQDDTIRRFLYVPGSAAIFDILKLTTNESLVGQDSIITVGDRVFYYSSLGFRLIAAGQAPVPIGKERVDRTFAADLDTANLQLFIGSADPAATRVFWAYRSQGAGSSGRFDALLCYDWGISARGRWSLIPFAGEYLASLAKPGLTLENMDAIAPGAITITGAANNGAGAIRLTVSALSNASFSLGSVAGGPSQNFIEVQGVTGTTEANGSWAYTIVDATHIDLTGSAFTHAYVSGGAIGGSLDALPFSLDNISLSSSAQLGAVDPTHAAGFFSGDNMEAIIETPEADNDGDMSFCSQLRPITDCAAGLVSVGYRNVAQGAITYTAEAAIDTQQGQAPVLVESRYMKARLRCPAGSTWSYARGIQPEVQAAGEV